MGATDISVAMRKSEYRGKKLLMMDKLELEMCLAPKAVSTSGDRRSVVDGERRKVAGETFGGI
ncbi:uncharacterized protein G2W53_041133 [Senna tora]|uniref:Uncharacterized protein n=1 Tax=Senna tora TaxID=362788 RepID=A0A834SJG3_9FABA|nr:uncharacterized protein G2W53_041133 [Senna tora]